jgi:hypothetical protein
LKNRRDERIVFLSSASAHQVAAHARIDAGRRRKKVS